MNLWLQKLVKIIIYFNYLLSQFDLYIFYYEIFNTEEIALFYKV